MRYGARDRIIRSKDFADVGCSHTMMADMHLVYGAANQGIIKHLHQWLCETGTFKVLSHSGQDRTTCTLSREEAVVREIELYPSTSTWAMVHDLGVLRSSVMHRLHEELLTLSTFNVSRHSAEDYHRRVAFACWVLQEGVAESEFPRFMLFTDEATFAWEGVMNVHNWHMWVHDNSQPTRPHGV